MHESRNLYAGLSIIATPIGNLGDISPRAVATLAQADTIACEDTRMTRKLLGLLGIKAPPLLAYHDHNAHEAGDKVLSLLRTGKRIALVSDAGSPLISDPGFPLVRACAAEGIPVTALPGPAAPILALQLSGLPSDRFLFAGFAPSKMKARRDFFASLASIPATLVFFETGPRLAASLADMVEILGARDAAIARELTKMHESVRRDRLENLAATYAAEPPPKGEIVVVIGPPEASAAPTHDPAELLRDLLKTHRIREAADIAAALTGQPRKTLYSLALSLRDETENT